MARKPRFFHNILWNFLHLKNLLANPKEMGQDPKAGQPGRKLILA